MCIVPTSTVRVAKKDIPVYKYFFSGEKGLVTPFLEVPYSVVVKLPARDFPYKGYSLFFSKKCAQEWLTSQKQASFWLTLLPICSALLLIPKGTNFRAGYDEEVLDLNNKPIKAGFAEYLIGPGQPTIKINHTPIHVTFPCQP